MAQVFLRLVVLIPSGVEQSRIVISELTIVWYWILPIGVPRGVPRGVYLGVPRGVYLGVFRIDPPSFLKAVKFPFLADKVGLKKTTLFKDWVKDALGILGVNS